MPRNNEELQKHTLYLFLGDYAKLQEAFPDLTAAAVIRHLVRRTLRQIETTGTPNINVEIGL